MQLKARAARDCSTCMHCAVAGSLVHKFENYANITLKFKDVRSAFIEANWLTPRKVRRLTVTGTEGILQVEYITQAVTVETM